MKITLPEIFSYDLCLSFLERSPREVLHRIENKMVTKVLSIEGLPVIFKIRSDGKDLEVDFLNAKPSGKTKQVVEGYIREWFDMETDLKPFYALVRKDELLKDLVKKFHGYRIIGQPDLFESLIWAVLGQQINLPFAYTLKQRFVQKFGERIPFDGIDHYLFPDPKLVATLGDDDLLPLQFSRQKANT